MFIDIIKKQALWKLCQTYLQTFIWIASTPFYVKFFYNLYLMENTSDIFLPRFYVLLAFFISINVLASSYFFNNVSPCIDVIIKQHSINDRLYENAYKIEVGNESKLVSLILGIIEKAQFISVFIVFLIYPFAICTGIAKSHDMDVELSIYFAIFICFVNFSIINYIQKTTDDANSGLRYRCWNILFDRQ